eukprot:scaffold61257_cov34-Tisochrysis_lutea.AAC.4
MGHNPRERGSSVTRVRTCTVSDGHSNACVRIRSYKKGVFFFQTLYYRRKTQDARLSSGRQSSTGLPIETMQANQPFAIQY